MKITPVVLVVFCCVLSACDRRSDTSTQAPGATASPIKSYEDQIKQQQAQLDAYDKHSKHVEEQLRAQADMQTRADALLAKQEEMLKRQQDDFVRFEKILETWESQQKQYQKYLDSLLKQ
jgi:hypothetical protein